jgi:YfiH family protein
MRAPDVSSPQSPATRLPPDWVLPEWPAPSNIGAFITARSGGESVGPFGAPAGGGMNLGLKSGDDVAVVQHNRARLRALLPADPVWLQQEHGARVVDAEAGTATADAATALAPDVVCAVSVADCLPVLLCDADGRAVAAAHAGWRGLAAGVLQNTVQALRQRLGDPRARVLAYLGPAIGPQRFEVGEDVLQAMRAALPRADAAFVPLPIDGKYLADLVALARQALGQVGVEDTYGGALCTASDPARFYSFRRDKVTGRHVAVIWRKGSAA